MWSFQIKLVVLAALILSACQPQIVSLTPPPTPQTWQVETTPALRWLGPVFQGCTAGLAGANLVISERGTAQLGGPQADFSFQWGDRAGAMGFAVVIARDALAIVVNPANPAASLTPDDVRALFSGKISNWNLSTGAGCASCGLDFSGSVLAYIYAPGEDVRAVAGWIPGGPAAVLAPGPAEVRAAVAKERYSVGYLPARWLDASVKAVPVVPVEQAMLSQAVLAFAPREPQGAQRAWLACVQNALK